MITQGAIGSPYNVTSPAPALPPNVLAPPSSRDLPGLSQHLFLRSGQETASLIGRFVGTVRSFAITTPFRGGQWARERLSRGPTQPGFKAGAQRLALRPSPSASPRPLRRSVNHQPFRQPGGRGGKPGLNREEAFGAPRLPPARPATSRCSREPGRAPLWRPTVPSWSRGQGSAGFTRLKSGRALSRPDAPLSTATDEKHLGWLSRLKPLI